VLVGSGPAEAGLRARQPRAIFAGPQSGALLAEHYACGDLFLFPSLTETYGNVVAEAMASGLPVVAYRSAAAAELIVPEQNGMLAAPGDEPAFIEAALWMAADAARRSQLAEAARICILPRSWHRVVERFEHVALEAIGKVPQTSTATAKA